MQIADGSGEVLWEYAAKVMSKKGTPMVDGVITMAGKAEMNRSVGSEFAEQAMKKYRKQAGKKKR